MFDAIGRIVRESVTAPVVLLALATSTVSGIAIQGAPEFWPALLTIVASMTPVFAAIAMQYIAGKNATELKKTEMVIAAEVKQAEIKARAEIEAARILAQARIKAERVMATETQQAIDQEDS
jgi:hypothetical protein